MAHSEDESRFRNAERDGDLSANLAGIDLHGVLKSCPRLNEFDLSSVNFHSADLAGAHFQKANLSHANLSHAKVTTSDFRDANLQNADLTSANLNGAVMTGANLSNANLKNTILVKARVNNVDFTGANLDGTDLRGARGLTKSQLESAVNGNRAILDERMLASTNRSGDTTVARHGRQRRQSRQRKKQFQVDLTFDSFKPSFGDVFLLCGCHHPQFPPVGDYGFDQLADLEIKQVDDYFAICPNGDPAVWIFPLVRGRVVEHHPGPFDGIRIELSGRRHSALWTRCVRRFKEVLAVTD